MRPPVLDRATGRNQSLAEARLPTGGATTAQSATEVLVPPTAPLSQVYTPGVNTSQRYIIHEGTMFTPGDGSIYYINPGYSGFVPGYVYPPPVCTPGVITNRPMPRSGFNATIQSGSTSIRIGR